MAGNRRSWWSKGPFGRCWKRRTTGSQQPHQLASIILGLLRRKEFRGQLTGTKWPALRSVKCQELRQGQVDRSTSHTHTQQIYLLGKKGGGNVAQQQSMGISMKRSSVVRTVLSGCVNGNGFLMHKEGGLDVVTQSAVVCRCVDRKGRYKLSVAPNLTRLGDTLSLEWWLLPTEG